MDPSMVLVILLHAILGKVYQVLRHLADIARGSPSNISTNVEKILHDVVAKKNVFLNGLLAQPPLRIEIPTA